MVYCAGHYTAMDADAIDLPDMLRHVDINYVGALHLLDAVLPHLLARGPDAGSFVSLVGSVAGYGGLPRSLAYGPTKAALINLAQTLYLDLRDKGVAVSIINPGFVETPLTAQNRFHMPALLTPQQAAQRNRAGLGARRLRDPFPEALHARAQAAGPAALAAVFHAGRAGDAGMNRTTALSPTPPVPARWTAPPRQRWRRRSPPSSR